MLAVLLLKSARIRPTSVAAVGVAVLLLLLLLLSLGRSSYGLRLARSSLSTLRRTSTKHLHMMWNEKKLYAIYWAAN